MKVAFEGFELSTPNWLDLDEFATSIVSNPEEEDFDGIGRLIFTSVVPSHVYGVVLTVKDQRVFIQMSRDPAQRRIKVSELGKDTSLIEVNYFIINKKSLKGVYQQYRGSLSMSQFLVLLRQKATQLRGSLIEREALTRRLKRPFDESEIKKIKKMFKGFLRTEAIVRQEKLEEVLSELASISDVSFGISMPLPQKQGFAPLEGIAQKKSMCIKVNPSKPMNKIVNAILVARDTGELENPRVHGKDDSGLPVTIRLSYDNLDVFDAVEFDEIAKYLTPDPQALASSGMIKKLLQVEAANAGTLRMRSAS